MYEDMKVKVEHVIDKDEVTDEYITDHQQRQAFNKWTKSFTRMDHPTVIQVCLLNLFYLDRSILFLFTDRL